VILRHYLDLEKGDLFRALGRYNGSVGRPLYPNTVLSAWQGHWSYPETPAGGAARRMTAASM
jgi:soluble lytic murein transglycosylase-like protein